MGNYSLNNFKKRPDTSLLYNLITSLLHCRVARRYLLNFIKRLIVAKLKHPARDFFGGFNARIQNEKKIMFISILESVKRSLEKKILSRSITGEVIKLWHKALTTSGRKEMEVDKFYSKNGCLPPFLLVISPGHSCNLRCAGCYASAGNKNAKLSWGMLDRIIDEARRLWDIKLVVFSGGEPFNYKSGGKDILDIAFKYPDCLFLVFTNGTLIDKKLALRIAQCKNITPALSVEGMEATTDKRRGSGIFEMVNGSMKLMREFGVPFGLSITVNRDNCNEVLSDDFLDYFFCDQGAFYGFYFQYLPIGRSADFSLMPTPYQRYEFWNKIWKIIESKKLFLLDFWNHGTLVNGCLAAGREGGYLHIDWNGKVMPCVFTPYSAGNINDIYNNGGNLNTIWELPLLKSIRNWQREHGHGRCGIENGKKRSNLLLPCPFRDHYIQFLKLVDREKCESQDSEICAHLQDSYFIKHMSDYNDKLNNLFGPLWSKTYEKEYTE